MSPRTSTWTEVLAPVLLCSSANEAFTYLLGSIKRMIVKMVDRKSAIGRIASSMVDMVVVVMMIWLLRTCAIGS